MEKETSKKEASELVKQARKFAYGLEEDIEPGGIAEDRLFSSIMNSEEKRDYDSAFELFQKAAEMGDAAAKYNLGLLNYYGLGVKADKKKAFDLFSEASNEVVFATFYLGMCYHQGEGVEKDAEKALSCYLNAAERGYKKAYAEAARFYLYGIEVAKDEEKAKYYFGLAEQK